MPSKLYSLTSLAQLAAKFFLAVGFAAIGGKGSDSVQPPIDGY